MYCIVVNKVWCGFFIGFGLLYAGDSENQLVAPDIPYNQIASVALSMLIIIPPHYCVFIMWLESQEILGDLRSFKGVLL